LESEVIVKIFEGSFFNGSNGNNYFVDEMVFYRRDIIGIIGQNGAGKSSFCKELKLSNFDASQLRINRSQNEFKFFSSRQFSYYGIKTIDLIKFYVEILDESEARKKQIFKEIFLFLRFKKSFLSKKFEYLSSGEKSRVLFAVKVFTSNSCLIIDEGLNFSDLYWRKKSLNLFRSRMSKNDLTIIVSHDFNLIKEYSNKLIVVKDNEIKLILKLDEGFKYYGN